MKSFLDRRGAPLALPTLAALVLGFAAAPTARAQAADAETKRMMSRLAALSADSMEGRRAGTPGSQRARRWIIGQLTAMGVRPLGSSYEQRITFPVRAGGDSVGANIVARIPGTRPGGAAIVLSAHYDHLGVRDGVVYNGADDDASGCVALLMIAERLLKTPPTHDVILAFFDNEEGGMHGSRTFVSSGIVPLPQIALNINLDMVARQDGKALWVAGTSHYPMLKPLAEAASKNSPITIRLGHDTKDLKPGDDWTNSSDHAAFHAKQVPFLYLGVEDHPDYHKPGDDADKVDPAFYRATVDFAHRLLREADQQAERLKSTARPSGSSAQPADTSGVLAAVNGMLTGMRTRNADQIRNSFHEQARLTLLRPAPDGGVRVVVLTGADFVNAATNPQGAAIDEPIRNVRVQIDGDLASVWAEYQVRRDGKVSHCGFDAFHLVRVAGAWKILNVSDTYRQQGCGEIWRD